MFPYASALVLHGEVIAHWPYSMNDLSRGFKVEVQFDSLVFLVKVIFDLILMLAQSGWLDKVRIFQICSLLGYIQGPCPSTLVTLVSRSHCSYGCFCFKSNSVYNCHTATILDIHASLFVLPVCLADYDYTTRHAKERKRTGKCINFRIRPSEVDLI